MLDQLGFCEHGKFFLLLKWNQVLIAPHRREAVHDGRGDGLHEGEHGVDAQRDEHQEEQEGPEEHFSYSTEKHLNYTLNSTRMIVI